MLWNQFGAVQWLIIVGAVAGGVGRLIKGLWKTLPKTVLPWLVLGFAYIVVFADLKLGGSGWDVAALTALSAALSGGLAIGGHEMIKKAIGRVLGETFAELLLGVLESKLPPPPKPKATKPLVSMLALLMLLATAGCTKNGLNTAITASNSGAITLKATHAQIVKQRFADQMSAARAVPGDRADPATQVTQLEAAATVGRSYRPAWAAYEVTRFAWLRLVGMIKLARAHPELFDPVSLLGAVTSLAAAQADLAALANLTMHDLEALPFTPPQKPTPWSEQ